MVDLMVGPLCQCAVVEAIAAVAAVVVGCSCSGTDLVEARNLVVVVSVVVVDASCSVEQLDRSEAVVVVRYKGTGGSKALGLGLNMDPGMVVVESRLETEAPDLWSGLVRTAIEYMVRLAHCVDLEIRVDA